MDYRHLFGPVPSRRLGVSLGVDLVPYKCCTLDCVYCECGSTTDLTVVRKEYIPFSSVSRELEDFFSEKRELDFVTFSGSGEPTLNSAIGSVIGIVKQLSSVPVAVLTNGTLFSNPQVRKDLLEADLVMPSLDAALPEAFRMVNRPHPALSVNDCIQGLLSFRGEFSGEIRLEVFILPGYNDDRANLDRLREVLEKVRADSIELNTLDRPGTVEGLKPAGREMLQELVEQWNLPGLSIIAPPSSRRKKSSYSGDTGKLILETIRRRPCTLNDLSGILGMHRNEVNKYLSAMEDTGEVETVVQDRGVFYRITGLPTGAK